MIDILEIDAGSIAEELGIRPGDRLVSINGHDIRDNLDYRFYCAGEELEVLVEQESGTTLFEIEKDDHDDIGLILEDLKMRKCGNKCIFCFVHQSPKGLRRALYFKDEDYRFSFLYGHYVTLTNATQADLDRIVEQRLTPLYISVHVTDSDLRKFMLGIKFDDYLLEKIDFLTTNGIELHCQIVLCPELNDGKILQKTLTDLKQFYPGVKSVAIVPVGLTRHRKNLPQLKPITNDYSLRLMDKLNQIRRRFKKDTGSSFVYLSDEFFIRTGRSVPPNSYYEGFHQLENGVGLTRDFLNRFKEELPQLAENIPEQKLDMVSGVLGSSVLKKHVLPKLKKLGVKASLHQVINRFYGETIVVSGLLVGQDIFDTLKDKPLGEYVILPPRVLNLDGLFLDDWTIDKLEEKLNRKVIIYPDSFTELFRLIDRQEKVSSGEQARENRHRVPESYIVEHMKAGKD